MLTFYRCWPLLLVPTGCDSLPRPPKDFRTTTVAGRVTCLGQPCGPGWITAIPTGQTTGTSIMRPVAADGAFTLDGVALGEIDLKLDLTPAAATDLLAREPRLLAPPGSADRIRRQFPHLPADRFRRSLRPQIAPAAVATTTGPLEIRVQYLTAMIRLR